MADCFSGKGITDPEVAGASDTSRPIRTANNSRKYPGGATGATAVLNTPATWSNCFNSA